MTAVPFVTVHYIISQGFSIHKKQVDGYIDEDMPAAFKELKKANRTAGIDLVAEFVTERLTLTGNEKDRLKATVVWTEFGSNMNHRDRGSMKQAVFYKDLVNRFGLQMGTIDGYKVFKGLCLKNTPVHISS